MAAAKKKQDDKNLAILRELITQNGNKNCFDCSQRGPTYVNMTIGSFVCSKCSGMLRGLTPPHRVKSISMASFTPEEILQIKSQGNDYCKSIWLALHEGNLPQLKDEQSIKGFMFFKYERRQYYLEPDASKKTNEAKDKPTVPNVSPKDNGIWNSSSTKLSPPKVAPVNQVQSGFSVTKPVLPSNTASLSFDPPVSCPRFPVDFASADIFNSSKMNNNLIAPVPTNQATFANFDMKNSNTVAHDRYAALADLDFALRQQGQTNDNMNTAIPVNPFDINNYATDVSKNPFSTNTLSVNGSTLGYSNPFAVGSGVAPTGPSKNPFL